jgi:hypothetical protein
LAIEIDPDLLAQLRQLSKAERRKVGAAIESVRSHWGRPRLHTGAGIRRLGADLHECRIGLQTRLLFQNIGSSLYFHFMGNHDEVQKFLRAHT